MATCPKCLQEKPLMAKYCHQCMQPTEHKDQFVFSGIIGFLYWAGVFYVAAVLFRWLGII